MKKLFYFLIVLLAFTACKSQLTTKTVKMPPAAFSNTRSIEITKVTLSDSVTMLDVNAFYIPKLWIKIASDSYLQADDKKFMIRSGEGIDLDSLIYMPKTAKTSFKLLFEPLPLNTETFDFIESDCRSCFKIWGIDLVNK